MKARGAVRELPRRLRGGGPRILDGVGVTEGLSGTRERSPQQPRVWRDTLEVLGPLGGYGKEPSVLYILLLRLEVD